MSTNGNSRNQLNNSDSRLQREGMTPNNGAAPNYTLTSIMSPSTSLHQHPAAGPEDSSAVPLDGTIQGSYPRPALPPPLPPVQRDETLDTVADEAVLPASRMSRSSLQPPPRSTASMNNSGVLMPSSTGNSRVASAHGDRAGSQEIRQGPTTTSVPPSRPPTSGQNRGTNSVRASSAAPSQRPATAASSRATSKKASKKAASSDTSSTDGASGDNEVEELMEMPLTGTQPIEKFFIEYTDRPERFDGQPRNDNEMLLEQFAEYTDDDSFFSSSSQVIECDPQRLRRDPMRRRAVGSVHNTLQLRALTNGRVPEDTTWNESTEVKWLYQIHNRAIALQYSSLFAFPAKWMPRVVVYNVMHHWMMEMFIFLMILGYSIFTASWARYTSPKGDEHKPDPNIFADVFYTCLLGFEIIARIFASGLILHPRSFFRSPWHWLDTAVLVLMIMECTWWRQMWNFTAWRLIRTIKCFSYVPIPVRMKLLAKSLLRSTNKLINVTVLLIYFIFFFGLIGLQLFVGTLHSRCVNELTGGATDQVCRPLSTGQYWFYWGYNCGDGYTCVGDAFPNPYYDFRSYDDIGHAMLSAFQIMTFQDWSGLLIETNDAVAVMCFLYYAFTILVCTYIIPSLFLGVFMEKIEKTSRLYVLKQLDFFEKMLTEQRQRMSTKVRLRDYVERDEEGFVSHYPIYDGNSKPKRLTDDDVSTDSDPSLRKGKKQQTNKDSHHKSIQSTKWTDEQRIQLHLSLTRQRHVAERAERRKLLQQAALGDLIVEEGGEKKKPARRAKSASAATALTAEEKAGDNFALGGRVGAVQHHPSTFAIGKTHQTDLPFAVRQEGAAEQLRFLDPYTGNASTAKNDIYNSTALEEAGNNELHGSPRASPSRSRSMGQYSRTASTARPPLGASRSMSVIVGREAAGIVPSKAAMSTRGSMSRVASANVSRMHASMSRRPHAHAETVELVINDPEGGDFGHAKTFMQKVGIIRNIIHMFTEGYPRIITQYLWEHRVMQYRYGLTPLTHTNRYEEEALRRLRERRSRERDEERNELRRNGMGHLVDEDPDEDGNPATEKQWMRDEGLVPGSMSPIRMAQNIKENAPMTVFNYIWLFFIIANAVFNASRYDTMPDYWEMGTFVAGVCFSVLFMLELLIRLVALGPGPFFTDLLILIEAAFMVISLFQLGFSRTNTTSLFNWVRFLRLFRVVEIRPMRRVARVLIHGFADMVYALVFFTMYMFMWLLLGMSFFGSRMGWIDYSTSEYYTEGSFETFSYAAYAVAQAFSVNRDQWVYLSWSGMRVRGGYTIMYFMATVGIAFIFRFFFIAVMTYAWQSQQELEDYSFMSGSSRQRSSGGRLSRLPWFDFSVWRSFKHIHGGFGRRDVAPDEVYFLNADMTRQLRMVEAKDRYYTEQYGAEHHGDIDEDSMMDRPNVGVLSRENEGPRFVNLGGRLYRQPSLPATEMGPVDGDLPQHKGQLRFARQYRTIPATTYATGESVAPHRQDSMAMSTASRSIVNPLLASRHSLSPGRNGGGVACSIALSANRGDSLAQERANNGNVSIAPRLQKLGNAHRIMVDNDEYSPVEGDGDVGYVDADSFEHLLLPGPRLRYKSTVEGGRRVFDTCLDCNTHKQMPLRAPAGVAQRTADQLHNEHCHMAAVRSSQQLVLNALIGYARMQADHEVTPTKRMVEIVLGQAWSCGMLLFETIEHLSCMDLPEPERNWDRMLEALELQQWLIGLHVGEEQVGRATLAYILAHQQKQEAEVAEKAYKESFEDYAFFCLAPSNPFRRGVTWIVNSMWFEIFILFIIYAASVCLAVYTPGNDDKDLGGTHNSTKYDVLHILDDIFSVIFAVEMVLKWISMGVVAPVGRAYFWHLWNIFDCFIVIISLVSWGMDDVYLRYLKVMRCFRILGPLRYWKWGGSSMSHVARAIWDSIPTLANVCLLMLMNYIVWCILFVSMFMNKMNYCSEASILNKTACVELGYTWYPVTRNFRNFYESLLTTFELSTGAEWMDVMYNAVSSWSTEFSPIPHRHPYLGLVFIAYYYVSHFVLFSLFMSALIYCYMLAKSATEDSAGMTVEHQVWLRMQGMVLSLKPKTRLVPLNNGFSRLLHKVVTSKWFELFMSIILYCNMIIMALEWYHMSSTQELVLNIFQWIFVAIFTIEVIMRLIAHGLRFFTRWAYCFDLFMVVLSFLQIGLNTTQDNKVPFNMNVLRMLRVGRALHLVNMCLDTHLSLLSNVVKSAVPGLISVTFIYMIAVYVFTILGLHFLGYIVPYGGYINDTYNNFGTFVNSMIMVFRLSTLENWVAMLRGSLDRGNYCNKDNERCGPTNWAPVFYVPIVICFYLMLSTMYMAVILDKYVAAIRLHSTVLRLQDIKHFCELWSRRDPNGTKWLPTAVLPDILEELRLPLGVSSRHNRTEMMQLLREYDIPDHHGMVSYYEVLLPLARRVMAMAFNESADAQMLGDQDPNEIAWRLTERALGAMPSSYQKVRRSNVTVAEQYAASYIQAAYRRDKAMRSLYVAKSARWREGRRACEEMSQPYGFYGFGRISLDGPDPREEGLRRGFNVPANATLSDLDAPLYGNPMSSRLSAARETSALRRSQQGTILPATYRSAIAANEKRFGPDAPGAIRRHERRDEKLQRKRAQEAYQRQLYEDGVYEGEDGPVFGSAAPTEEGDDSPYREGTAASSSRPPMRSNASASALRRAGAYPGSSGVVYNMDPNDVNYQPPLGTDPQRLLEDESNRRRQAADAVATATELFGGVDPPVSPSRSPPRPQ